MAKWVDMGHAMRRRIGAPSNHLEAAGPTTGRMHQTSDEHYETAKKQDSPRASIGEEPMGSQDYMENSMSQNQDIDSYENKAAKPVMGTMVPRGNTQSQDPTAGGAGNRMNVLGNSDERHGASYNITATTSATVDPTVGPTMANARVIPSVMGRQNPNFEGGMSDSY